MKKSQFESLIREVIRETIRKVDGKYVVYPVKGGKRLGTHSTKKAAEKQLTAIHLNKEAVEPNFDFEWKEAARYPEFKKLGKDKWIELAKTGKAITITSAKDINNTDANEPNAFKTLDPDKQKRALAQLKSGNVEMPIVALYPDGYKELIGGNTRLSAMMSQNKKATIWQFEVPEEIVENYSELEQYRKLILKQLIDSKIGKQIRNAVEDKVGKEAVEGVYIIGSVLDSKKFHEESDIDIAVLVNVPNMDKGTNEKMSYELSQTYSIPDGGFVDVSIWNRSKPLGKMVKLREGTVGADHLNKENYADGKEKEIVDDILSGLNEGKLDGVLTKMKQYAKKGLLTLAVIASVTQGLQAQGVPQSDIDTINQQGIELVQQNYTVSRMTERLIVQSLGQQKFDAFVKLAKENGLRLGAGKSRMLNVAQRQSRLNALSGINGEVTTQVVDSKTMKTSDGQYLVIQFIQVNVQENYADGKGKYIYIGTCMNSFDDYGECKHNAFYDEEHFFNSWNAADEISKEEFWSNIDPSSDKYQEVKKYEADPKYTPEYRYSPEDDIYYIFINDDTHYFFVNPDTLRENYADGKVKGKSRPGRVKKAGASCKGSVTDLRAKAKKYGGEKGKMYHWCANMKGGKKK